MLRMETYEKSLGYRAELGSMFDVGRNLINRVGASVGTVDSCRQFQLIRTTQASLRLPQNAVWQLGGPSSLDVARRSTTLQDSEKAALQSTAWSVRLGEI